MNELLTWDLSEKAEVDRFINKIFKNAHWEYIQKKDIYIYEKKIIPSFYQHFIPFFFIIEIIEWHVRTEDSWLKVFQIK